MFDTVTFGRVAVFFYLSKKKDLQRVILFRNRTNMSEIDKMNYMVFKINLRERKINFWN